MLENLALAKLRGYFLKDYRLDALFMGGLLSNSGYELALWLIDIVEIDNAFYI